MSIHICHSLSAVLHNVSKHHKDSLKVDVKKVGDDKYGFAFVGTDDAWVARLTDPLDHENIMALKNLERMYSGMEQDERMTILSEMDLFSHSTPVETVQRLKNIAAISIPEVVK